MKNDIGRQLQEGWWWRLRPCYLAAAREKSAKRAVVAAVGAPFAKAIARVASATDIMMLLPPTPAWEQATKVDAHCFVCIFLVLREEMNQQEEEV
jgi:hypothetical protein